MSACEVENGHSEKTLKPEDNLQDSGLKRMQVVEGGTEVAKLLDLKEPSPQPLVNGETAADVPQQQEFEVAETKVKEEEIISEVKEEDCTEEQAAETNSHPVEETSQPRPASPKDGEMPSVETPAPAEEVSRKRSIEKDQEGDGSSGSDSDSSRKKNRTEQETEPSLNIPNGNRIPPAEDERERMISDFVSDVSMNADSLSEAAERLAKEVENLAELAAAKEMEWNTILRLKKFKEEILERVLRRKRMNHFDSQFNSETPVPEIGVNNKGIPGSLHLTLRHPRLAEMGKLPQRPILPKPLCMNFPSRDGRNRPVVDVKSIIDDYSGACRSRHPESPARRGRRVRTTPEQRFPSINPSLISMANMALGTGASVRTVTDHNNFMGMGGVEHPQPGEMGASKESGVRGPAVGANGAKPYPEVTLHPVSPPSLLHQVLTKSQGPPRPASNFSPTLARLLTAPERPSPPPHFRPPSRVSIADILSSTKKSRNEITITPVSGNPAGTKKEDVVCLDDDDGEPGDRLVIDEGGDDVPTCQGCRHKSAQFVCAGCGNQWYCSRECQVSAWEEHSDMCSG